MVCSFPSLFALCSRGVSDGVSLCPTCCLYSVAESVSPYQLVHVVAFALIRGVFGSAVLACTHFRSCLCSIVRVGEAMFGCVFVYVCFVRMTVGVCWSVDLGCHIMIVSMGYVC